MKFVIDTAKPIKAPLVVRFGVTMFDEDDNMVGEYEIALNLESYIEYQINDGQTNVNVNAVAVQQEITSQIAELQIAGLVANGFEGLEWIADEEGDDERESESTDESDKGFVADGDTTKLSPVLPEGN
jgi:hypothetical protein